MRIFIKEIQCVLNSRIINKDVYIRNTVLNSGIVIKDI